MRRFSMALVAIAAASVAGCTAQSDDGSVIPTVLSGSTGLEQANDPLPGTLAAEGGCVVFHSDEGSTYPIVWSPGTTMADPTTVMFQGQSPITLGTALPNAHGQVVEARVLRESVAGIDACVDSPSDSVFVLTENVDPTLVGQETG